MKLLKRTPSAVSQLPLLATADTAEALHLAPVLADHPDSGGDLPKIPDQIHIERLIMHKIDHWNKKREFADAVATFGEQAQDLFSAHIKKVLEDSEWNACFGDVGCTVSSLCDQLLGMTEAFVQASKDLAQNLYDAMATRSISRGDFAAVVYRHDDEALRRVAIFKLDLESRQVRNFNRVGDKVHLDITENDNILPTPDQRRVTKCALLTPIAEPGQAARFHIRLLDPQAGPHTPAIATFFYRTFLQAELLPNARRQTQEFWRASSEWIDKHELELSAKDKVDFYEVRREALSMALTVGTIEIDQFAHDALHGHEELQDQLASELGRAVAPFSPIPGTEGLHISVDPHVAKPMVRKVIYELDRGARLIVPASDYHDLVKIEPVPGQNKHRIVIETQTFREVER